MTATTSILLLEDDIALCSVVADYLALHGYDIDVANNASDFEMILARKAYDLVLLDLNLPDADGLRLLARLRQQHSMLVYVVSGRQDESSRIQALELGADDFIAKPFSARELELKIRNAVARLRAEGMESPILGARATSMRLNHDTRELEIQEHSVVLTRAEFELLAVLFSNIGKSVTRDTLLNHLSETANVESPGTLDTLIYRLRKKMQQHGLKDNCIITLPSVGFRLERCAG